MSRGATPGPEESASAACLARLRERLAADRSSERENDRDAAAGDASSLPAVRPDFVVWPESADEVVEIVRAAADLGVPLTARGGGSSLEGNPIPLARGGVLDFTRMQRVLEVSPDELLVRVEPGVVYSALNRALRPHGLFFPVSPGGSSDVATIGGMAANNASGIYAVKYGATRAHVRQATVVTGRAERLTLGSRCRKTSSGYDLLDLVIGSEGTLAVITELTLALAGLPAERRERVFAFADDASAARAVVALLRYRVDVAAVEFVDRESVRAVNRAQRLAVEEAPLLFLEAHGSASQVSEADAAMQDLAADEGGRLVELEGGASPWGIRHLVTRSIETDRDDRPGGGGVPATRPGSRPATMRADLAVPVPALPGLLEAVRAIAARRGIAVFCFGHAGLGIIHVLARVAADTRLGAERGVPTADTVAAGAPEQTLREEIVTAALALGGSLSGEHGIGLGNRASFSLEHGAGEVALMRAVKQAFDPHGILNPGKIWPPE